MISVGDAIRRPDDRERPRSERRACVFRVIPGRERAGRAHAKYEPSGEEGPYPTGSTSTIISTLTAGDHTVTFTACRLRLDGCRIPLPGDISRVPLNDRSGRGDL